MAASASSNPKVTVGAPEDVATRAEATLRALGTRVDELEGNVKNLHMELQSFRENAPRELAPIGRVKGFEVELANLKALVERTTTEGAKGKDGGATWKTNNNIKETLVVPPFEGAGFRA